MLSVSCPRCSRTVTADAYLRFPPWCPLCGADLKARPEDVCPPAPTPTRPAPPLAAVQPTASAEVREGEPPLPVVVPAPTVAVAVPRQARRYIEGRTTASWSRGREVYRLYTLDTELLVLNLGRLVAPPDLAVIAAVYFGGLLGALAVSAATGRHRKRSPAAERGKELDHADEMDLRVRAEEGGGSFPLSADDVDHIRIDPPSFWGRLVRGRYEALLTIVHRRRGKLTLKLLTFSDVWRAAEDLPRLFGTAVVNNLPWGSGGRRGKEIEETAPCPEASAQPGGPSSTSISV